MLVVVGPNGAGKTTFYARVLEPVTHLPFINADLIAEREWPGAGGAHAYEAAELAAAERSRCIAGRRSFATETVCSHPSKLDLLAEAREAGYVTGLHVCMIPEDLAVARVADRVADGGHPVAEDKIRARFHRLWPLVAEAVTVVDEAVVYDNSKLDAPFATVAKFRVGHLVTVTTWPAWAPRALKDAGTRPPG
jgi:predicted ABC-type ATPase